MHSYELCATPLSKDQIDLVIRKSFKGKFSFLEIEVL